MKIEVLPTPRAKIMLSLTDEPSGFCQAQLLSIDEAHRLASLLDRAVLEIEGIEIEPRHEEDDITNVVRLTP
jgi:hypothetical protein